jgi:hypothetical protein
MNEYSTNVVGPLEIKIRRQKPSHLLTNLPSLAAAALTTVDTAPGQARRSTHKTARIVIYRNVIPYSTPKDHTKYKTPVAPLQPAHLPFRLEQDNNTSAKAN